MREENNSKPSLLRARELGIEKLGRTPRRNPILRTWEVWGKGEHRKGTVYRAFRQLNTSRVTMPLEPGIDDFEAQFHKKGIQRLLEWTKKLPQQNRLQRERFKVLHELLYEFNRKAPWSVPQ